MALAFVPTEAFRLSASGMGGCAELAAPAAPAAPLAASSGTSASRLTWWQAAGALCTAFAALGQRRPKPRASAKVPLRVYGYEEEDGPDHFFRLPNGWKPKVRPAWNRHTSPSKVSMGNSVTFFFPNKAKAHQDTEYQGYCNPKMYKRVMPDRKLANRARRTQKRAWRKLSNKLKNEWRFRRYPRDESGKVSHGVFNSRSRPTYLDLKGASRANKQ
ncbi:unnamed protein product [Effrenium voratum]|uniref:Uncharacterized protein n=1 Tax=Effrenium voratum TaxID=2562239 RepID=A0AA36J713_9DINO|nr:unnamed protein product [Effrenium voratum]CAJ1446400.1 unnamed protein product [Effrenium voratum]